ncbi:MAG: hypothetical protein GXY06_07195, partial [Clostridiaceae bacterium]|nr:hypothetical protein [Clostridiaceae bacterium]
MRLFKSLRQTIAILLSALLILPLFPAISLSAEIGNTIYEYERFIVTYKIVNEWEGNQNVEII